LCRKKGGNAVPKFIKVVLIIVLLCLQYACLGWIVEKPTFALKEVSLTLHSMKELEALLTVSVDNPNRYDLTVTSFEYRILLGEKEMSKGSYNEPIRIPKTSQQEIKIPLSAEFDNLGAIFKAYISGQDIHYRVEGIVHVKALWGSTTIPLVREGHWNIK
jgi:LEA14-like dessication related protein